ncbi:uncharacterized protein LOC113515414 [Galleria mellonella]|uniref:Uncharacterized protein LOC113515414 n=1 Tax=Galleria mellonella TaxID=7137 RepID=A0A6J1WSP0_GALME|nr:uncharacterized protein LOC113515414 [Galleria mellonella]
MYRLDSLFTLICFCGIVGQSLCQTDYCSSHGLNVVRGEALDVWLPRNARVAISTNQLNCSKPDFYICEEPPDLVPLDDARVCNYRNGNYHEQIFHWVAGCGCLLFTPDFLFVGGANSINMSASCLYERRLAPCIEIAKKDGTCGCYPFDPGLDEVVKAVQDALIPTAHERWQRCFYAAKDCCDQYLMEDTLSNGETRCGTTFDGWTCWRGAPADTIAYEVCSEFAYSNSGPTCSHYSSKPCYANGTWEQQTDYSTCSVSPRLIRRYHFHIGVLSFSIISCLPAVFIFFFYKRLRITRVILHRNLLVAIIIRNVLVIISRSVIYIDELSNSEDTVLSNHGVGCRMLSVAERVAANAVFVCMLTEGIYLHRLIVAVFKNNIKINWLYGFGAVIAIVPVVAWAIVMSKYNDHSCWVIYTVSNIQWILDTPRVAILLINTILFADVMRVLLTKVRNSENANQLNTAKASLFLMPIFGIQFLLTAFRPTTSNCTGEQVYYYIAYSVEGLQGFIVAMLYCYVNKEVRMLVKATYRKTESAIRSRVRGDSIYPRMSNINSDRRFTYSTGLPSQQIDDLKNDYATVNPKLHVAEIISIDTTEKLADILEPVYETIGNDTTNEDYSFVRSNKENISGCNSKIDMKADDYYGFTNASSISIECPDWIRDASSPKSSVYKNSQNDYETKFSDKRNSKHMNVQEMELRKRNPVHDNSMEITLENDPSLIRFENKDTNNGAQKEIDSSVNKDKNKHNEVQNSIVEDNASGSKVPDNMLDEIMHYMGNNDSNSPKLNPDLFSPNRKEEDKIIFVD